LRCVRWEPVEGPLKIRGAMKRTRQVRDHMGDGRSVMALATWVRLPSPRTRCSTLLKAWCSDGSCSRSWRAAAMVMRRPTKRQPASGLGGVPRNDMMVIARAAAVSAGNSIWVPVNGRRLRELAAATAMSVYGERRGGQCRIESVGCAAEK